MKDDDMTYIAKKISLISAFTVMILSQNTAFAQTVLVAEAPAAAQTAVVSSSAKSKRTNVTQAETSAAQVIKFDKTQDKTKWLLKPEAPRKDTAKAPRDYSKEFTGLRTSVLANNNNTKIGTATQYIDANEIPFMKADRSTANLYSKTDDNFLLRAKLDF